MPSEIRNILVLTETPFRERDFARLGIATLARRFNVHVLDCTALLRPEFWQRFSHLRYDCQGYRSIATICDFKAVADGCGPGTLAIDYLFSGNLHQQLREFLRRSGILRVAVWASMVPSPRITKWQEHPRDMARRLRDALQRSYHNMRCQLNPFLALPTDVADIALLSGSRSLELPKAQAPYRIPGHSFDFDIFLELRSRLPPATAPYAVFLDQNLVENTDRLISGTPRHVSAAAYYPALNRFFADFEQDSAMPIVIAAHPRASYPDDGAPFGQRRIVKGQTATLIQGASLVFAHYSTGISFSVLWRKPLVLLTSRELKACWRQSYIDSYQWHLETPMIDVDDYRGNEIDLERWLTASEPAYTAFLETHIKMPGTPELPLWDIFSNAVLGLPG